MQLKPIAASSNIEAIGYDAPTRTLGIRFRSGGEYHYHDVPDAAHEALLAAPSAGAHFYKHINGKFRYTKRKEH
jgi:hypothetical protein